jgi:hypothetical protein
MPASEQKAICLRLLGDSIQIKNLSSGSPLRSEPIEYARTLGSAEKRSWLQRDDRLHLQTPSHMRGNRACTFKIAR